MCVKSFYQNEIEISIKNNPWFEKTHHKQDYHSEMEH